MDSLSTLSRVWSTGPELLPEACSQVSLAPAARLVPTDALAGGETKGLGVRQAELQPQVHHFLAVLLWAISFISLSLNFPICSMRKVRLVPRLACTVD